MSTFLARSRPLTYEGYSDEELVKMCVDGDRPAWDALILRHVKLIYSIALDYGFNKDDSRDVVQNVCLTLFRKLHTVKDRGKVYSWLMTATFRECMNLARRRQREVAREGETEEPFDPAGTLEEIMISAQKQRDVRDVAEKWDTRCGQLLRMLYFEECSHKEAAARLRVSHNGIGSMHGRCLEEFRSMLSERGITNL
jgi:RNA polymerase sigma factor (sigma-70 family)